MSTTVWFLLAVCAVASVLHRAPVVSQCTTKHCHDDGRDVSVLTALVERLQDTVELQEDLLEQQRIEIEQQRKQNHDQQKQLTRHEETLSKQDESRCYFPTATCVM